MSKKHFILLFITISVLLVKTSSKLNYIESEIVIDSTMQSVEISHDDNLHLFTATFDKSLGKFIFLLLYPKDYENDYNHIFVSIPGDPDRIPTYKESDYKTIDKNTTLLIETQNIPTSTTSGKITIECKERCDFTFYYQIVDIIPLVNDRSFDLILNSNEEFELSFKPEVLNNFNNKFTFFSNAPSDFTLTIIYNNSEIITPLTDFYNGYGLFVDNEKYPEGLFTFKLSHYGKPKELVHVSNRQFTKEIKKLSVGDFHNSITGIPNLEKECFNLPKVSEEANDKNYNLNFLTYTKNILITFDGTDTATINSESDFIQIDAKKYTEMCFSSSNGGIATTTFQLLDGTEQTLTQDAQMPLYRGVPKKSKLLKGQIAYYRLYFYPSYSENLVMNLKSIEGKAKLYYGICTDYPNCNFQEDQLSKLETSKDINNNIFIKKKIEENMTKPYSDPEFQVAIVFCENNKDEKDCEYFITMSNDNDKINLIENQNYYSSVQGYKSDEYQFNIYDPNNELEYLYMFLYSYTGQGQISVYSDKEMTKEIDTAQIIAFQNIQIALIMASSLPDKTLKGNYYIKIYGLSNTIYSIYYYSDVSDKKYGSVLSNEVNIWPIKSDEQKVSFFVKNKGIHKKVPFLYEYNSLNCDLEVSLEDETEVFTDRNHQFVIDSTKSYYNNDYYEMKIKPKKADIAHKEIRCLIALTGGEVDDNSEILLSDGVIQKGKLTKNVNYVNYLYTFIPDSLDDDITLYYQKDSNYVTDLSYAFENSDLTTYKVVNTEKKFVFRKEDYSKYCMHYNESCTLKIQIKINNQESITDNSYIDFMLSVNNKITYPSYLPKDTLIKNVLQTNQFQYYYLDIGKNEECDIILDFNEGFGQAIAKIVKMDDIEENPNYNRRVVLPLPGMQDNYIFDQYTKELKITKDMTSKCDNGCEIYIAIFHSDSRYDDLISSYSIFYRKKENIVYLPENTFGHGNLKSLEDTHIFRTKINKNTDTVIFNIIGEHTVVYINLGEDVPSSESKKYTLDSDIQNQLIINSDAFEGQIFTYVVTTRKLGNNNFRSYDIKISTPDSKSLNIELIDYLHNNPCYFDKNNIKCNYMLPVEKYNSEKALYLFTPDDDNTLVYANYISMEEFDSLTPEEKSEKLPKKTSETKNYLLLDISERKNEIYVLITVETTNTENKSTANLVVGGFIHPSTSFLRPNVYSFYYIKNDGKIDNINLSLESEYLCNLRFKLISGNGRIFQSDMGKTLDFGVYSETIFSFSFEPELKNQKIFKVNFTSNENADEELYFYTYLESTTNKLNVMEMKYPDIFEQKYEFLQKKQIKEFLPFSFYELIPNNKNEDMHYIIQIFDRLPYVREFDKKIFTVSGYIFNKTTIEDIQINPSLLEKEKVAVNGGYDNKLLTSDITFTKDIIEKYATYEENYLYIYINKTDSEIIEFNYTEIDILKSSLLFTNIKKYVSFKIKEQQNKNLLLVPELGAYKMAVEIFVDGKADLGEYNMTINPYYDDNEDYSQNTTSIIDDVGTGRDHSKQYFLIHINPDIHYIVVNVIKNTYIGVNDDTYFIRYRVESSNPTYYYLADDRNISYTIKNSKIKMSFNAIQECKSGCTYHDDFTIKYFASFYDSKKIGDKTIRNIIVDEEPLYQYNITKYYNKGENRIEWEEEMKEVDKEQLLQIIGYASYDENEEMFVYQAFVIVIDDNSTVDNTTEFLIILLSFIGIIVITFIGMYVYIYAKIEIGRRTLMLNSTSGKISLVQRSTGNINNTNPRMTI